MGAKHIKYSHSNTLAKSLNESTYDTVFQAVNKYVPREGRILDVGSGA